MVAELELEVAGGRERMHRLLGLAGEETTWRSSGELAEVPEKLALPERLETKAIEASIDLAAAKSRLLAIAHRTSISRTEGLFPDVEVDVHTLYGHPEDETEVHPLWRFGAGVSVSLPIFDQNQGTTLRYESEFDAESERLEATAIDLRSAVREMRSRVVSAHARALHYQQKILPAQRRVVDQTLLQYNAMQLGIFQLLEAHRAALDLELQFVETLREYWSAQSALDTLLAGRLIAMDGARPMMPSTAPSESMGGH
jgi:outer membrane protein TolC